MTYFSEFSLGSDKQGVRLAFSTASPVSVVNSPNCEGCDQSSFGFEYQKSHSIRKIHDQMVDIKIEGQKASGVLVHDDLYFDESHIKEFPFLLINAWDQN